MDKPLDNEVYAELHPLLKRLDYHQSQLAEKETLLQQKQDEFDTIISKIKEGMVIVDAKGIWLVTMQQPANYLIFNLLILANPCLSFNGILA